jgi:hypothetical protein
MRQAYWLWRDRKGLAGSPASLAANLALVYGAATWGWSRAAGEPWGLAANVPLLAWATLPLTTVRIAVRMGCVAPIYGWKFACGAPLRIFWGNFINFLATASALRRYAAARRRKQAPAWLKTEHVYPSRAALAGHKQALGEVLVRACYVSKRQLEEALSTQPPALRLGEHLMELGYLTEQQLYEGLSLQQNVKLAALHEVEVPVRLARGLPAEVMRRWRVLPFRVRDGKLHVAGPELPGEELQSQIRDMTHLDLRFHFITPTDFQKLEVRLLGAGARERGGRPLRWLRHAARAVRRIGA